VSKEIKSLLLVLSGIFLFILGFNFLKGTSLFDNEIKLHTIFENVEGLQGGTSITVNGLSVGKVNSIDLSKNSKSVIVTFRIRGDLKFSKNSIAELYEAGLIGGKSIAIIPRYDNSGFLESGDTLKSSVKSGFTQTISDRIVPLEQKLESILTQTDTLFVGINSVLNDSGKENLSSILNDLSESMSSINSLSSNLNDIILKNESIINNSLNNVSSISENFKLISDSLSKSSIKNSIDQFNRLTINLNSIIDSINYGSGSLSLLLNEDSLYQNLKHSSDELNSLLKDLKLNPKRYVHFSLFGKKDKPFKVEEK